VNGDGWLKPPLPATARFRVAGLAWLQFDDPEKRMFLNILPDSTRGPLLARHGGKGYLYSEQEGAKEDREAHESRSKYLFAHGPRTSGFFPSKMSG
jgi:hypothetical protein